MDNFHLPDASEENSSAEASKNGKSFLQQLNLYKVIFFLVLGITSGSGASFATRAIAPPKAEVDEKQLEQNFVTKSEAKDKEDALWVFINRQIQIRDQQEVARQKQEETKATKADIESLRQLVLLIKENGDETRTLTLKLLEKSGGK